MPEADTPRDANEEGPPVTQCPQCGVAYWDPSVIHCDFDGAYLEPTEGNTRVDRIVGGRYRLIGKIGQGGMGTVYLAENGLSGRRVALKIIRSELERSATARRRFLRECEVLERIDSPHVVQVLESGESPAGEIYLVMERLLGTTLGARLEAGPLALAETLHIASQVASALDAAHAKGVVHRDLKPENVFLCDDGVVKVLDFGIARLVDGQSIEGGARKLTATGTIVGTPAYMSPEGAAGEQVGKAGDLYSLGVMLYEMVAGRLPFSADPPVLVLSMHLTKRPPPLEVAVPEELERLIFWMLEKDPEKRPASATEVLQAFNGLASGVHTLPSLRPRKRVPRWVVAAIWLTVLALLGGAAAVWLLLDPFARPPDMRARDELPAVVTEPVTAPVADDPQVAEEAPPTGVDLPAPDDAPAAEPRPAAEVEALESPATRPSRPARRRARDARDPAPEPTRRGGRGLVREYY